MYRRQRRHTWPYLAVGHQRSDRGALGRHPFLRVVGPDLEVILVYLLAASHLSRFIGL
jgi:hypothetical protein